MYSVRYLIGLELKRKEGRKDRRKERRKSPCPTVNQKIHAVVSETTASSITRKDVFFALTVNATNASKMSAYSYQNRECYMPEENNLHNHRYENLLQGDF